MTLMIWLIAGIMILLAASASSVHVPPKRLSAFERQRRLKSDDPLASKEQRLERYGPSLVSFLRLITILLIGIVIVFITTMFGPWTSVAVLLGTIIVIHPLARLPFVAKPVQKLFDRHYGKIIDLLIRYPIINVLLRPLTVKNGDAKIHSREELEHVLDQAAVIVEPSEHALLHAALQFEHRTVDQIMIPYDQLATVSVTELLGPLVLDDLHKTGQRRFLVVNASDQIKGVLYLDKLLTIDAAKGSVTADKAMRPGVIRLQSGQSLRSALKQCIDGHHDTAIILDGDEVTGMVTIDTIIATLLGRTNDT